MAKENKRDYEELMWIGFVLLLIALIVVYLISAGKVNFLQSSNEEKHPHDERKKKLEERVKILDYQYERVQKILERKLTLKKELDHISKNIFIGVRLFLVFLLILFGLGAHVFLNANLRDLFNYLEIGIVVLCFFVFVLFGNPTNITSLWDHLTKKLTLYIYGRYINLDVQIASHNEDLKSISSEKQNTQKELTELIQMKIEIQDVLSELDNHADQMNRNNNEFGESIGEDERTDD